MKTSRKLVPRLFGVNKESIVRVDEKTKEVLQVDCVHWRCISCCCIVIFGSFYL